MGVSENANGLILAMLSSLFIGTSFILKKKGLKRAADHSGTSAGINHFSILPLPYFPFVFATYISSSFFP